MVSQATGNIKKEVHSTPRQYNYSRKCSKREKERESTLLLGTITVLYFARRELRIHTAILGTHARSKIQLVKPRPARLGSGGASFGLGDFEKEKKGLEKQESPALCSTAQTPQLSLKRTGRCLAYTIGSY